MLVLETMLESIEMRSLAMDSPKLSVFLCNQENL